MSLALCDLSQVRALRWDQSISHTDFFGVVHIPLPLVCLLLGLFVAKALRCMFLALNRPDQASTRRLNQFTEFWWPFVQDYLTRTYILELTKFIEICLGGDLSENTKNLRGVLHINA